MSTLTLRDLWVKALQQELHDLRKLVDVAGEVDKYYLYGDYVPPKPLMVRFHLFYLQARAATMAARSFDMKAIEEAEKESGGIPILVADDMLLPDTGATTL